jgi:hypothetical protein
MARRVAFAGVCAGALLLSLGVSAQVPPPKPGGPPLPPPPGQPGAVQAAFDGPIKETLQQYATAYESLNAEQVKKVWPTVDVEGLRRAFREMRELKVGIDSVKVLSIDGAVARVSCRVMQTLTPKAGNKQASSVTRVFRLRKQEAVWLIDGFER